MSKKDVLLNLLFLFCICYLLKLFIRQVFVLQDMEYYSMTEWLINFEGGFVRRGIRGEIIYSLYHFLGLTPRISITIIGALSFFFLIVFFFKGFVRKGYSIFILPFVFFLGNPILNRFWLKPDSLLVISFVVALYLIRKPKVDILNIFLINIILIIGVLLHEIFLFIAFPAIILFISYHLKTNFPEKCKNLFVSYLYACLCLIPSFIVTLLVIVNNGSPEIATTILESWKSVPFSDDFLAWLSASEYPGAFEGMTKTMHDGINDYVGKFVMEFYNDLYGPLMIVLTIAVVYFILLNVNKLDNKILCFKPKDNKNTSLLSSVLILQLLTIIPLCILGYDYARWIFFWVTFSFALILIVPHPILQVAIPRVITITSDKISCWVTQTFGMSKGGIIILCLFIGFPGIAWGLIEYLDTSMIFVFLRSISGIFKYLLL